MTEREEYLLSVGRFDIIADERVYGGPYNGMGPRSGDIETFDNVTNGGFDMDASDLRIEVSLDEHAKEALILSELQELIFESHLAADYDAGARQTLEVAVAFQASLERLQADNIVFTGNTQEELDAVVELMHEANPATSEEELVNLVYELIDHVNELIAERDAVADEPEVVPVA